MEICPAFMRKSIEYCICICICICHSFTSSERLRYAQVLGGKVMSIVFVFVFVLLFLFVLLFVFVFVCVFVFVIVSPRVRGGDMSRFGRESRG